MRAASDTSWSKPEWMKSANWISAMGRSPASARPIPIPMIELSASEVGSSSAVHPLFKGEVTSLESHYDASSGTHTVVRAYDRSHRLMKHRTTRAWEETDLADLARTLAGDVGLSIGSLMTSGTRYPYVAQLNETNWDFLHRLAREANHEVVMELGELQLRPP